MKNIIIAALAVCTLSACDDFLDEKLKGDFNSDNIFSNATQAMPPVPPAPPFIPALRWAGLPVIA